MNYQQAVEYCEKQFSQGESIERLVGFLKIQGFDVISSIKILRESAKIPLADAKRIVVSNPVWEEQTKEADEIHEQMLNELRNDPNVIVNE